MPQLVAKGQNLRATSRGLESEIRIKDFLLFVVPGIALWKSLLFSVSINGQPREGSSGHGTCLPRVLGLAVENAAP